MDGTVTTTLIIYRYCMCMRSANYYVSRGGREEGVLEEKGQWAAPLVSQHNPTLGEVTHTR